MADWPIVGDGQRALSHGATTNGVLGTTIERPAVPHTKVTSFTQLVAATTIDAVGIYVAVCDNSAAARYFVDIAVGAANFETVIVPDLYFSFSRAQMDGQEVYVPVSIPKASRITARFQSSVAGATIQIAIRMQGVGGMPGSPRALVQVVGNTLAATSGTTLSAPGVIDTQGAVTELLVVPYTATASYSSIVTGSSGLMGYWRMDEASGSLTDSSGNGNTATVTGTPTYSVAGALLQDSDTAISYPGGSGSYHQVVNSATMNVADVFSIVAWIKKASNGTYMAILSRMNSGYSVRISNVGNLQLEKNFVATIQNSTVAITDTSWHMIAVTKNGAVSSKLYIDGVNVGGTILTTPPNDTIVANGSVTRIGGNPQDTGNGPWNGRLDEVALWNVELTSAQITALYAAGMGRIAGTPAVTPYPIEEVILCVESSNTSWSNASAVLNLTIGSAGATTLLRIPLEAVANQSQFSAQFIGPLPCHIPENTRIWASYQVDNLAFPPLDLTLYGMS